MVDYRVYDAGGDRLVIADQSKGKIHLPHGCDREAVEDLAKVMNHVLNQQQHETPPA